MAKNFGTQIPRVPGVPHRAPGIYTPDPDPADEAVISPVERWEKILSVLMENGEIPVQTELQIHKQAWRLTRADAHRAKLRALASQYGEKPRESGASYAWRHPSDNCARCANRYCECPDRQR